MQLVVKPDNHEQRTTRQKKPFDSVHFDLNVLYECECVRVCVCECDLTTDSENHNVFQMTKLSAGIILIFYESQLLVENSSYNMHIRIRHAV